MSECKTESCCTAGGEQDSCCQESRCPVETSMKAAASCCPAEMRAEAWGRAFMCAMKEVHVEILKEKIRKSWGSSLEKEADAVLNAMSEHWHSFLVQSKAQADLRENLRNIMKSNMK